MKHLFKALICMVLVPELSLAQTTRFLDPIFSGVTKTTVTYSDVFSDDYHKMDIYTPNGDNLAARPVIMYVHGGAFYAGDKGSQDCIDFCNAFAKKGYVAISVNYRLANAFLFLTDKKVQLNAVLQSIADVKAAFRYMVKEAKTTNQYRIDTSALFLGGYSAGAVASLHTGWVTNESELDANLLDILKNGIKTLDGDAGNNGYSFKVKALFSLAGGLYSTQYVSQGDIPVWMGHAKDDATVSYNCAPGLNNPLVVTLCGTGKIIPHLDTNVIKYDTMILETGGHNWPALGNNGKDFKNSVTQIAEFFYPMIPGTSASNEALNFQNLLVLYPNPCQSILQVSIPNFNKPISLEITNALGETILVQRCDNASTKIDISNLPSGIYRLTSSDFTFGTHCFVVQH